MKNQFKLAGIALLFLFYGSLFAQDVVKYNREIWLKKAEEFKPELSKDVIQPKGIVELVEDERAFQGWTVKELGAVESIYERSFNELKTVIVDFGNHYTGYFSMNFRTLRGTPDGPLRFKLTFAEVPAELATPFDPYPGALSRAWLQDEIITVTDALSEVKLERRISGRYMKIELLGSSRYFDFAVSDLKFTAVTSVKEKPETLAESADDIIKKIDQVGLNTLKECMQTVYEDGPKRDQRLWIGDLYLESIANAVSYNNHDLTKRCLYLLAGLSDERGVVHGTVFEAPEPHPQSGQFLYDYALLFNVTLKEYFEATNDKETVSELFPVAKRQLEIINDYVQPDGIIDFEKANSEWWLFFDWKNDLHKAASVQGLSIFALSETYKLAELVDREDELKDVPELIKRMKRGSMKLYNKKINLFESGSDQQISYASQIWMILGGVLSKKESQKTLNSLLSMENAVQPGGPYMYHYFIQALVNSGMHSEAKEYLVDYWGGMVKKGADTFWEVYDPDNDYLSPYNFYPVNSYCHAWSCTPVYFIRKYPEIFQ